MWSLDAMCYRCLLSRVPRPFHCRRSVDHNGVAAHPLLNRGEAGTPAGNSLIEMKEAAVAVSDAEGALSLISLLESRICVRRAFSKPPQGGQFSLPP